MLAASPAPWVGITLAFLFLSPLTSASSSPEDAVNSADKGKVLIIQHPGATKAFTPQAPAVSAMIREGLVRFTGKDSVSAAWSTLVTTQDVVGIKVHSAPGANSGTRPMVVAEVVRGLLGFGLPPQNIIIWDRRLSDLRAAGYTDLERNFNISLAGSLDAGFSDNPELAYDNNLLGRLVYGDLEFGRKGEGIGRKSHLSNLLAHRVTRIINITPLLNHNLAGVSGALYCLSMPSVDNVLRFELDPERLATAIPEIYAKPELSDRVVLNIVDALICQYQGEERSLLHYSIPLNEVWFSRDPVAADVLALNELDKYRKRTPSENKLIRQIYSNASLLELGISEPGEIQSERIPLE